MRRREEAHTQKECHLTAAEKGVIRATSQRTSWTGDHNQKLGKGQEGVFPEAQRGTALLTA
jgi:hypothetical protein